MGRDGFGPPANKASKFLGRFSLMTFFFLIIITHWIAVHFAT